MATVLNSPNGEAANSSQRNTKAAGLSRKNHGAGIFISISRGNTRVGRQQARGQSIRRAFPTFLIETNETRDVASNFSANIPLQRSQEDTERDL